MDYEISRASRQCAQSERTLADGEPFFSVVVCEGGELRRLDFAVEAWNGPPENALGWWKSRMPNRETRRTRLAPHEVLLAFMSQLEELPGRTDLRYVLALWMLRRRILRWEESYRDAEGQEWFLLQCNKDGSSHRVQVLDPGPERIAHLEQELSRLLTEAE